MPAFSRGPQESSSGNGNSSNPPSTTPQDMSSEDRISHMLSESGHLQLSRQSDADASNDADSKSPSRLNCPSPFGGKDSQNRRLKKYENDDIPQEKVARIYQEELAKIMGRRVDDLRGPRDFPAR